MKKAILITVFLAALASAIYAQQARFIRSGSVTYQKTVNMYAIIQKGINKDNEALLKPAFETYKEQHPQFKQLESTLVFDGNRTLFTPIRQAAAAASYFNDPQISMQNNIVYTDFSTKTLISKRKVFDDNYLLKDNLKGIKWKFTDEVRDIAGYSCHRANGITLDSVYVVAFYTDKIPVSGGPELFGGLPGMILQVALPHENVSWVATKVDDIGLPPNAVAPPVGGTVINFTGLVEKLKSVFKDNGRNGMAEIRAFLL